MFKHMELFGLAWVISCVMLHKRVEKEARAIEPDLRDIDIVALTAIISFVSTVITFVISVIVRII